MSMFRIFLLAMCLNIATGAASNSSRIVGGEDATEGEIPYQLMLKNNGVEICGGSLIQLGSVQAVITAAHCLHSSDPDIYSVVAGEHDITVFSGNEQTRYVSKVTIHPEYNERRHLNDIAILLPRGQFELNKFVAPIRLPKEDEKVPEGGLISGWGDTDPWRDSSNVLQKAIVSIVDNTICNENYQDSNVEIVDSMVCAAEKDIDSCQGDSGGPMAAVLGTNDFYLLGVVSFGRGCARPTHPGVYTRVSSFTPWITKEVAVDMNMEYDD